MSNLHKSLEDESCQKKKLEEEIVILRSQLLQLTFEADQVFNIDLSMPFMHESYPLCLCN